MGKLEGLRESQAGTAQFKLYDVSSRVNVRGEPIIAGCVLFQENIPRDLRVLAFVPAGEGAGDKGVHRSFVSVPPRTPQRLRGSKTKLGIGRF